MIIIFDDHETEELLAVLHDIDPDDPRPWPMQLEDPLILTAVSLYVIKQLYRDERHRPVLEKYKGGTTDIQVHDDNLILIIGDSNEQS